MASNVQKWSAEFVGTFWLTFGGCGSAVLAAAFPGVGIGLLGVSLAFGLTVLTGAYALGHISGGHFNPAVTLGLVAGGRFCIRDAVPYIVAQVVGGLLVGIVALFWLARLPRTDWDDWLGNLSYGVFLCHFLVMWLFEAALGAPPGNAWPAAGLAAMMAASVLLAWLGFVLVERPVLRWRHRLRSR